MASQLLAPRWLLGHILVVVVTVVFVVLGFWQLDRHYQQREANQLLEERLGEPPVGVDQLITSGIEGRSAVIAGTYDYSRQLELRPRARSGQVGYEQVVPLVTQLGVVLVNRGFVADAAGVARETPQRADRITVTGTVRGSQAPSSFGPQNPDDGRLDTIARVDIDRLNPQFDNMLLPVYLDLVSEAPPVGGLETVVPDPPAPTGRPNLPYAIQWWSFAAIAGVGWALYLRKQFFSS